MIESSLRSGSTRFEARDSWRLVELARTERARGVPQRERARQPQQQLGLPPGPSSGDAGSFPDPILHPSGSRGGRRQMYGLRCVSRVAGAAATAHRLPIFTLL